VGMDISVVGALSPFGGAFSHRPVSGCFVSGVFNPGG
tara:strand:+ start:869 stop:979 length:111 start_codon:yes stop_codon:yes gene_type:complete